MCVFGDVVLFWGDLWNSSPGDSVLDSSVPLPPTHMFKTSCWNPIKGYKIETTQVRYQLSFLNEKSGRVNSKFDEIISS